MRFIWTIEYFLQQKFEEIFAGLKWFFWSGRGSIVMWMMDIDEVYLTKTKFVPALFIPLSTLSICSHIGLILFILYIVLGTFFYLLGYMFFFWADPYGNVSGFFDRVHMGFNVMMLLFVAFGSGIIIWEGFGFKYVVGWLQSNWEKALKRSEDRFERKE